MNNTIAEYKIEQTVTENNTQVHYTRTITITTENYYGTPQDYQWEIVRRDGQMVQSAQYPAHTEYAENRLSGIPQIF